jgi:hypothetical protein
MIQTEECVRDCLPGSAEEFDPEATMCDDADACIKWKAMEAG